MESIQRIETCLEGLSRRQRWLNACSGCIRGLIIGLIFTLLCQGVYKLFTVPQSITIFSLVAVPFAGVFGWIWGRWNKPSLGQMACIADQRLGLQERLSAAWEFQQDTVRPEWCLLIQNDAATHLPKIHPLRLLPFIAPRGTRLCIGLCVAAGILFFVPEYRSPASTKRDLESSVVSETGRQLSQLTRHQLEARKPALDSTRQALNEVLEFGAQLSQLPVGRVNALKDLGSLSGRLEQRMKELGEKPEVRSLEKAARQPSGKSQAADLLQRMENHRQALGSAAGKEDQLKQLRDKLDQLAPMARNIPKGDSAADRATREQLAQALERLAEQAAAEGLPTGNLDQAIESLRNAQTDFFLRDFAATLEEMDKLQELASNLQKLDQQMAQVAKTLADQLKFGQAKAAQATLETMVRQLQKNELTPEQFKQMAQAVSEALAPAQDYGEVAKHLQQALSKLGTPSEKEKSEAAQQLADAAKALEDLVQQMADAGQLADNLEMLRKAQLMIGESQNGMGRPGMKGRLSLGRGGRPGKGVGTWADEDPWAAIPQQNEGWDNSGIQQPELDPRGLANRGPGEVSTDLTPTRIKGQMLPGGSMQSITLKGVHIKGQSQVRLTEATSAAQTDAQSALNQDKVPRAYQDAVRHYFDDLK